MRTAVDANVVLDVFEPDPVHGERSRIALDAALSRGSLVACEVVAAEVASGFSSIDDQIAWFARLGLQLAPTSMAAAHAAGHAWKAYRRRGGKRDRVVADFLVAAHALHHADALLTRDRGYYKTYFPRLKVIAP